MTYFFSLGSSRKRAFGKIFQKVVQAFAGKDAPEERFACIVVESRAISLLTASDEEE